MRSAARRWLSQGVVLLTTFFAVSVMYQALSSSRNNMTRRATFARIVIALLAVPLSVSCVVAQTKQQVSVRFPLQDLKFETHQSIQVGDVPNHIVRVFELHYTVPSSSAPLINGLRLKEAWQRGTADIADGVGTTSSYFECLMDNGDKFFSRNEAVIRPTGSGKIASIGVGHIFGGTGKLASIQGTTRNATTFDPKAGVADEAELDVEYAIGRGGRRACCPVAMAPRDSSPRRRPQKKMRAALGRAARARTGRGTGWGGGRDRSRTQILSISGADGQRWPARAGGRRD